MKKQVLPFVFGEESAKVFEDLVTNSNMPYNNLDRKDYYNKLKTGQL